MAFLTYQRVTMRLLCSEEDVTGLNREMSFRKVVVRFHPQLLLLRVPFHPLVSLCLLCLRFEAVFRLLLVHILRLTRSVPINVVRGLHIYYLVSR
jgi:hypothetical protein